MIRQELDACLRFCVVSGALAVLLLPAARGHNVYLGWLPLWLLGMPLVAWWSLHRFHRPQLGLALPRRRRVQARHWHGQRTVTVQAGTRRS